MREGFIIKANWILFRKAILHNLSTLGVETPRLFYKKVRKSYKKELSKLAEYGDYDVLKLNLLHAVMLGAIYENCNPKPDINALARFYHDVIIQPGIVRLVLGKTDVLAASSVRKEIDRGKRSQKATHPYTWQYTVEAEDENHFTATFTKCGIVEYLKSRGMEEIIPAMCALDYTFGEVGNHYFLRNTTIATGGKVCDCHYVRKSAATREEIEKSLRDQREEAARGGLSLTC